MERWQGNERAVKQVVRSVVAVGVFLAIWEWVSFSGMVPITLFPPPDSIAAAIGEMARGHLFIDIGTSLWRAVVGWLLGSLAGVAVGLLTGRIQVLSNYLTPLINLFRPLPPVAIIPLVIVWFGIGETSKLFSIGFAVFFPVWINTHVGVQRIPPSFIWSAKSLKVGSFTIFLKVILPHALPLIVAGLRSGVAIAFVMVYVSELAGASAGLGYEISTSSLAYRVDRMIGALIVLGGLGALADLALAHALRVGFPWLRFAQDK
jgi:NitT/TauT family transport system permease protein